MNRSRGKRNMPGSPSGDPNSPPDQSHEWYQTSTWGLDENAFPNARELSTMGSSHPSHFHANFSSHAPVQPDLGNWQTNTGTIMYPQTSQAPRSPSRPSNQGEIMITPCVGCTRRMAKVKTNDKKAMEKTHPCHRQSTRGTKACSACSKGGRRCTWMKEPVLKDTAMLIQWGFQRVKERGGDYTEEENQHCDRILEELEQKYPPNGGSKCH